MAAVAIRALIARHPRVDWELLDDVILGCANQAVEDNRNVARMAALVSGLPTSVPGVTVNRLCGSGLDAIAIAARMIQAGEAELVLAGGVESMSRAPYVISKAATPFGRDVQLFDTTMGWRFVNPRLAELYGADSMPETAENVAAEYQISRADQDSFALRSQLRVARALEAGIFAQELVTVSVVSDKKGADTMFEVDEHPRSTTFEKLQCLPTPFRLAGTVTAGNSSGINDGACAVLLASESAASRLGIGGQARVLGSAVAGVSPRFMGMGPVPATQKLLGRLKIPLSEVGVIEINEAFAAQALAVVRALGLPDDADHINPNGGAIALGHPLGMSGARLVATATREIARRRERLALCTMCIGVGQGIALALERLDH